VNFYNSEKKKKEEKIWKTYHEKHVQRIREKREEGRRKREGVEKKDQRCISINSVLLLHRIRTTTKTTRVKN